MFTNTFSARKHRTAHELCTAPVRKSVQAFLWLHRLLHIAAYVSNIFKNVINLPNCSFTYGNAGWYMKLLDSNAGICIQEGLILGSTPLFETIAYFKSIPFIDHLRYGIKMKAPDIWKSGMLSSFDVSVVCKKGDSWQPLPPSKAETIAFSLINFIR